MERIKWKDTPLVSKFIYIAALALLTGGFGFELASVVNDLYEPFILTAVILFASGAGTLILGVVITALYMAGKEHDSIEQASIPIHEHRLNDDNTLNEDDQFNDPYGY